MHWKERSICSLFPDKNLEFVKKVEMPSSLKLLNMLS